MIDWPGITIALLAGFLVGFLNFGGLWLTVRHLPTTRHPVLLTMGSFLGRTALTVAAFYFIMGGRIENLLVSLAGFLVVRQFMFRKLRPSFASPRSTSG